MIQLSEIKPNPENPRIIKDDRFKKLVQSIKDFPKMMALRPLVVSNEMVVLGGNMRLKAIKDAGYTEIPDDWLKRASELTTEEQRRFIIADNVGFGENDWDVLAKDWDLGSLEDWGMEIHDFVLKPPDATEDDYETPDEIQTDIVLGDLFEIGDHRLLCGSSTEADSVNKLLNGKEPYLMVTDPPYGVSYNADWRNHTGMARADRAIGKVQNDEQADWGEAWALSPAKVAYVWHAGKYAGIVQESLESNGFELRSQIIWVKNNFAISRGDYHWKHEPLWYAVKKGSKGNWASDRKQTTVWEIDKPQKSETGHSTQKPVECMARPIANHDGDVYDPFLGSGTTMVAAHQLNRKCYGIEIDPKYCQVIVDRMKKLVPGIVIKKNGIEIKEEILS